MRKLKDLELIEINEILEKRNNGETEKKICSTHVISTRQYHNLLKLNGIERKNRITKYYYNERYFEKIDTEDKAYFLGFIVADGCIRSDKSKNMTLKLKYDDCEILEKFIKSIEYDGTPYFLKNKKYVQLKLSGNKIIEDLNNLGIVQKKTMIIKYPEIPQNLENHFMRGVFDGDGCISIHHDKRDNSERGQVNICSGSINFINSYVDKLSIYGNVNKNTIRCPKGTYYVIDWGKLSDVENIYKYFYEDATVYLGRKKETFDKVMIINNNKKKYRK